VPFGLNARQQNAWLSQGGGNELINEFYKKFNIVHAIPAATPAPRWAAGSARRSRRSPT
jgi:TRAP-type mannitol/chloroaromatic compound transport system substrate-binding protein